MDFSHDDYEYIVEDEKCLKKEELLRALETIQSQYVEKLKTCRLQNADATFGAFSNRDIAKMSALELYSDDLLSRMNEEMQYVYVANCIIGRVNVEKAMRYAERYGERIDRRFPKLWDERAVRLGHHSADCILSPFCNMIYENIYLDVCGRIFVVRESLFRFMSITDTAMFDDSAMDDPFFTVNQLVDSRDCKNIKYSLDRWETYFPESYKEFWKPDLDENPFF